MTWVSGSPKRALHSSRTGPSAVRMRPAYNAPRNGVAATGQLAQDRDVEAGDELRGALVGQVGQRRVRTHPAGVRATVAVEQALVVARQRQGDGALAVA